MRSFLLVALATGFLGATVAGAPQQDEPPDINFQFKVNQAIDKGIAHLKGKRTGSYHQDIENGNELILLTYLHADVPDTDADFQELLKYTLESRLEKTYKVALTAMCFEEYERVKYQWRIHQCAQFLADNISNQGKTRYGQPTIFAEDVKPVPTGERKAVKTTTKREEGVSPYEPARRKKPLVTNIIQVKQKRPGPGDYDHSNMQYSALGLRACHDAGIRFEPQLIQLVDEHWRKQQSNDQDARVDVLHLDPPQRGRRSGPGSTKATMAVRVAPQGWGYQGSGDCRGSMTAGAVGALCIIDYILGKDWREDKDVLEGLQWINKNFTVTENPKLGSKWYYYYMYGLERAGMLFGTEIIGDHRWYREGAEQLLQDQKANGGWGSVTDTCFAILFLKRATRRLDVATQAVRR